MSVNTLKCVNCNIVICELLSFIQNKIDVMDNESLIRICDTAFTVEEVDSAKELLFSSIITNKKKVTRRKEGKKVRDLEDIICVFKVTEPDLIPIFVARDLQKLPPVTFDHVDVTKLLKDLLVVRGEINEIKSKYATVTQLDDLKLELGSNRPPLSLLARNINAKKRGGYLLDSGPVGLSPAAPVYDDGYSITRCASAERERTESPKYRSLACTHTEAILTGAPAPINSTLLENEMCEVLSGSAVCHTETSQLKKPTMAEVARNGEWKTPKKPTDSWTLVQNRRSKNRFTGKTGKATTDVSEKFKAADVKIPLFISNVNKEVAVDDICKYIKNKTTEIVSLEKITMKREKPYNAFKVLVNKNKLDVFLDDQIWPDGVTFRRFIHFKNRREDKNNSIFESEAITKSNNG